MGLRVGSGRLAAWLRGAAGASAAALALWAAPVSALACYTGLTLIPTAETVGDGHYGLELQADGAFGARSPDTHIINTQFGLGPRLEAGVDYDLSDDAHARTLFNAKYLLGAAGAGATAAGVCNVGRASKPLPYAVVTAPLGAARAHLGAARMESAYCWFVGADHALTERLVLMADYLSGAANHSALGLAYQFNPAAGVTVGALFPNCNGDTRFTLHLVMTGRYSDNDRG